MTKYSKGEWTNARYDICEIECDGEIFCTVATKDVELIIGVLNENEELRQGLNDDLELIGQLQKENEQLKKENQRMTDKLNELALEFLNYNMVTMGKATEISEMCYYDFLKYRKDNGNPMELQL